MGVLTKRANLFVFFMTAAGAGAGVYLFLVFFNISVPAFNDNYILTLAEAHAQDRLAELYNITQYITSPWLMISLGLLVYIASAALLCTVVNPHINREVLLSRKALGKLGVAVLLAFLVCPVVVALVSDTFGYSSVMGLWSKPAEAADIIGSLISHITIFGLIWFALGQWGWLGDMATWGFGSAVAGTHKARTFALGALMGVLSGLVLLLQGWFSLKYLNLISEVLDYSDMLSTEGYRYLAFGTAALSCAYFAIMAGLATALSPSELKWEERKWRLAMPLVVFVLMCAVMLVIYRNGSVKYDLDKPDLASAVGLPESATETRPFILIGNSINVFPVPMEAEGQGFMVGGKVAVSEESLSKVEAYLEAHPEGSLYRAAALSVLQKGYYMLGDEARGLAWQKRASEVVLLPRLYLLRRLQHMPARQENLALVRWLSDEGRWRIGSRAYVRLARAYVGLGDLASAKKMLDQARVAGAPDKDLKEVVIPEAQVFTGGTLAGTLAINGARPEKGFKVAVFRDLEYGFFKGYFLRGELEAASRSLAGFFERQVTLMAEVDAQGGFSATGLTEGKYSLVLIPPKGGLPAGLKPEQVHYSAQAGGIVIDASRPKAELGRIELGF